MRLINRIIPGEYRYPTITPFTIPDGHTYLKTLEILVWRMKQIIDDIDENNVELFDLVVEVLNTKIDEINDAFTDFGGEVDDKLATVDTKIGDLETFVNNAVQSIINDSVEVQDPVLAGIIRDDASESRHEFNQLYAQLTNMPVNVRDYGAVGDGVTDDLPAFQAAFASLGVEGGQVNIPDGHYYLSDSLNIDCEYIKVSCTPNALIEARNVETSSLGHVVAFVGHVGLGTDVGPQRGYAEWDGGRIVTNIDGDNENALACVRYKQFIVRNLTVPVAGRKAVTAQYGVDHIVIDGVDIGHTGNAAVSIEYDCIDVQITNVTIKKSNRWGFFLTDIKNVRLSNITVSDVVDHGIYARNIENFSVSDVVIDGTQMHGINLDSVTGLVSIQKARVSNVNAVYSGLATQGTGGDLSVHSCVFDDSALAFSGSWNTLVMNDVDLSNPPEGRNAISITGLSKRPTLVAVKVGGSAHDYALNAASMGGKEPVLVSCEMNTGVLGKFNGWAPQLDVVASGLSAQENITPTFLEPNETFTQTITITGATVGNYVLIAPLGSVLEADLTVTATVSGVDTVTMVFANTGLTGFTPLSRPWRVLVLQPK